jgi:hypothetical protein
MTILLMSNFVDISCMLNKGKKLCFKKSSQCNINNDEIKQPNYTINYDNRTNNYYKTLRTCHMDPILNIEVDENIAFKFPIQWDPYTGERLSDDPFGALYFHPVSLIYYFYAHRLDGLWKDSVDTPQGYFEGYYDMLVGTGEELEVVGRAKYTELYLFRLPILDCYLTPDHNKSFITMGPKLSADEINTLEILSQNPIVKSEYYEMFQKNIPSIKNIKKFYDMAISNKCFIPASCKYKYSEPQHYYVDLLRQM